jgi:bacteriocin-like protein
MAIYLLATNYWIVLQPRTEMGARVMTTNNIDRELSQSEPELTEDELNHVSGGKYMEFKLKEVLISGVTSSAGANVPPSL